jgi:hypothetical protein
MYHCGFIIDDTLYSFGGTSNGGKILNEVLEINLETLDTKKIEIVNKDLVPPL